jgi:membrane protease YdiL (CAAX protease family)
MIVLAVPGASQGVSVPAALAAVPGALAVATIEEFLFRGVLFALWCRHGGPGRAVLLTSIAFAAAHGSLYPLPVLILGVAVGVLLGSWRALTGDLVAPILAHTAADAVAAAALLVTP